MSSLPADPTTPPTAKDLSDRPIWRVDALMRISELRGILLSLTGGRASRDPGLGGMLSLIEHHLELARRAAEGSRSRVRRLAAYVSGSDFARVHTHLDAAEAEILRLAPPEYVRGQIGTVLATVRVHLALGHPQRTRMEQVAARAATGEVTAADRDTIVAAYRAARTEARSAIVRIRSFRTAVLLTGGILSVAVGSLAIVGFTRPDLLPLCYVPGDRVVCPTAESRVPFGSPNVDQAIAATASSWDIPVVLLVGAIAAAVAAAAALRAVRGTSTPYNVPIALALLKLPTGALTAVLGLLLIKGAFIPGVTALDTSGQIIAYAIVFGYAQQLFTRLVDRQASELLEEAGDAPSDLATGAAAVTPEAIAGEVATTVKRSLSPGVLANYDGTLSVRALGGDGTPLPIDEDGSVAGEAGVAQTLEVTIGPDPEEDAVHAPIKIERGEQASWVAFEVELDGIDLLGVSKQRILEVEPHGAAGRVAFQLPRARIEGPVWVRLTQRGRLIQLVEIGIR